MLSESKMVKVRNAIELGYSGTCDVVEYAKIIAKDKTTSFEEVVVFENISCKLSFSSTTIANDTGIASSITQTVKLFVAPEVVIKPNSKIIVTQNGVVETYTNSGQPSIFATHQEIMLDLFREWA